MSIIDLRKNFKDKTGLNFVKSLQYMDIEDNVCCEDITLSHYMQYFSEEYVESLENLVIELYNKLDKS